MGVRHLKFLVEEPSMEAFLRALLPRLWPPPDRTFEVHLFPGKLDLLAKVEHRLGGYAPWLPDDWRIVVVVERDQGAGHDPEGRLEGAARRAGLRTRA